MRQKRWRHKNETARRLDPKRFRSLAGRLGATGASLSMHAMHLLLGATHLASEQRRRYRRK
jgi:hypothetical protein